MICFLEYVKVSILRKNTMKNLLLGIIAINLTFISANLAGAADPQDDVADISDLTTGTITAVISDDAEDSGEAEESDEGEDSGEDLLKETKKQMENEAAW